MRQHLLVILLAAAPLIAREIVLEARDTVAAIEMDPGDVLRFKLRNGQIRTLSLEGASAQVLESNLRTPRKAQGDGGTLYLIKAEVRVDGHPMMLMRYVGSQESFAEPYVVNGMRVWLDFVSDALALMTDNHGGNSACAMRRRARFAVNDARDPLAPVPLRHWMPMKRPFIDIANSYNGDDAYMGGYQGAECHAGLDINHPKGSPLFAPIDIHDHYYFNSLAKGDNNNRWRGISKWPNGDTWTLQAHHMVDLLVPEHTPLKAGQMYGAAAGVLPGNNEHSHFVFRTRAPGQTEDVMLDPWMLFWQMFQQEKDKTGDIKAVIQPRGPAKTGEPVKFSSEGTRRGPWGFRGTWQWTFGDGGFSLDEHPVHVYGRPGVYAVTLTFEDGVDRAATTHAITVDGTRLKSPSFALESTDDVTFAVRQPRARDTYGVEMTRSPHTIWFTAFWKGAAPAFRTVRASAPVASVSTKYASQGGWLQAEAHGTSIRLQASTAGLTPGVYFATVSARADGAVNPRQDFRVAVDVRQDRPAEDVIVDNADPGFYATPFFWAGHRFRLWRDKGYKDLYLTNGGRAEEDEFVRFTPNLRAGKYDVAFVDETPFGLYPNSRFRVTVRHKGTTEELWVEPARSRVLGTFEFADGTDGYVQLHAGGSQGHVVADAVRFRKAN